MRVIAYSPRWEKPFIAHPTDLHGRCFAAAVLPEGGIALMTRQYNVHFHKIIYQIYLLPLTGNPYPDGLDEAMEARDREIARNRLPQILKALKISDWKEAEGYGE